MSEYCKINTLFKRDEKKRIILEEYSLPEFSYLENNLWECTEKIDGTNVRIELDFNPDNTVTWAYRGRTDNASMPVLLMERLQQLFDDVNWREVFPTMTEGHVTLYGEGYGMKIQKGGNYIPDGVDFILFDVRVGNWWLSWENVTAVAEKLHIKSVPFMGYMTIPQAVDYVRTGFKSRIAANSDYDAEGLVLKNPYGILLRNGGRCILKIKTVDFRKLEAR